jgi:hypothetical protein
VVPVPVPSIELQLRRETTQGSEDAYGSERLVEGYQANAKFNQRIAQDFSPVDAENI